MAKQIVEERMRYCKTCQRTTKHLREGFDKQSVSWVTLAALIIIGVAIPALGVFFIVMRILTYPISLWPRRWVCGECGTKN